MPHALVVGLTKMGKTTLCARLAAEALARGRRVAVANSLGAEFRSQWPKNVVHIMGKDLPEFVKQKRGFIIFADEASSYIGHKPDAQDVIKIAANYGHYIYVIAQRARMIHPDTRGQCGTIIVFRQSAPDARIIRDEFARQGLDDPVLIANLPKGKYLYSSDPDSPAATGTAW